MSWKSGNQLELASRLLHSLARGKISILPAAYVQFRSFDSHGNNSLFFHCVAEMMEETVQT